MLRLPAPLLAALVAIAGCSGTPALDDASTLPLPDVEAETAGFVTRLGDDTLAVERFTIMPGGMEATVAVRAPRTTLTAYTLDLGPDGGLEAYEAVTRQPLTGEILRRQAVTSAGDSLRVTSSETVGETEVRMVAGAERPLPFVDLVHWPFELMARRAVAAGGPLEQPLFTSRGVVAFTSDVEDDGSVTVTHPFRGSMVVEPDDDGRLLELDAGATTRKLTVVRVEDVDVEAAARRWAQMDAAGRSAGELSGRAEAAGDIGPATISVDYGVPQKRGRAIWGALVPWGELWRTGANRATHLETNHALVLGEGDGALAVPAGVYTLFSIPEADGGVLIVNRQTGQGGTTYDEARDLGRVTLARSPLDETVEAFTIAVESTGARSGVLSLRWDRDAFSVPISVPD